MERLYQEFQSAHALDDLGYTPLMQSHPFLSAMASSSRWESRRFPQKESNASSLEYC
ncbi:hypothetical protein BJX76DRAFT_327407 [Aspergillus varians]